MPNYSDQIYNYILKLDPTYKNDVSLQLFKSKMANASYSKKIYDWIGTADPTFKGDVSFDAFNTKLGYQKKKVTTVSPSGGGTKPSSSASLSKAVSAGVQKAVESIIKPDGSYRYPGREDALYKKTKNQWYIDLGKTGNYTKVSEKSRVAALEKYAKAYTPVKTKEFTTVKSTVPQGVSQKINKEMTESLVDAAKILAGEKKPKAEKYEEPEIFKVPGKNDKEYQLEYSESGVPIWKESVIQYDNGKPITWNNGKGKTGYVFDYKEVKDPKRVATLNKMFNQTASSSAVEQTYVGYPGKDDVEYRINIDKKTNDPYWEKRPKGYNDFFRITAKGSIDALNAQFKKDIKYDAARDKFSGVAEDVELIKKKEFDKNVLGVNSSLIGVGDKSTILKKLKSKFPNFEFKSGDFSMQEAFGDYIEAFSPDGKNSIKISTDNWTDSGDIKEAQRLRTFIKANASKDFANASKALDVAEKENDTKAGANVNFRQAKPGDAQYLNFLPADQQPWITSTTYVTKEEKAKKEEKERLARKTYARESYLNLRDVYYKQKKAIETGKNPYDDKEVSNIIANLPNDKETISNASNFADDINKSFQSYNSKMKLLQIYADDANERIRSGKISEEEFNEQYRPKMEQLQSEIEKMGVDLKESAKYIGTINKSVNESIAAEYAINEERGTFIGGFSKKFVKGATAIARLGFMSKEEQDEFVRLVTGDYTTEEYMNSKNRNDFTKAIFGLGESLGALATGSIGGGGKALYASFFAQSYTEMKDELDMIKGPNGESPSEFAKILMSGIYGVASSILEKFGLDLALQKTGIGREITHAVIRDAFMDIPEDASKEFVQAAIINSTKKMLATIPPNVLVGATGEGLTGMSQAVSKIGIQEVYDGMAGSDYFNNKTAREIYADVLYDGYLEAIGGGVMSTAATAGTITGNEFRQKMNKEQLEVLMNAAKMENIDAALLTNLKAGIISGKYTKEESKQIYENFREVQGRINSMPDEMSVEDKSVALDLMTEKSNLEKAIANKDESLTAPQRKRIAEINVELIKIAENAVQKQTTSEVPVQPEAAVSGEVAQGEPQAEPQVATQEVGQAIEPTGIQEEVTPSTSTTPFGFTEPTMTAGAAYQSQSQGAVSEAENKLNLNLEEKINQYETEQAAEGIGNTETITTDEGKEVKRIKYRTPRETNTRKALDLDVSFDPRLLVLQYFVGGGKITTEAIQKLLGNKQRTKKITGELRYRLSLTNNKTGKNVEQIAHSLWEDYGEQTGVSDTDFVKYIENVLLEFTGTKSMVEEILKSENPEIKAENEYYRKKYGDNFDGFDYSELEDAESILENMTDDEIIQMANEIDAFEKYASEESVLPEMTDEEIASMASERDMSEMGVSQPTSQPIETEVEVTPVQPTGVEVTPIQPVAEAQPVTEAQPTVEAQPTEKVVAEEEVTPKEEVVAKEEVAPEEKPRTKEDIDADVAKMNELFGKTPPKFKKEKQGQKIVDGNISQKITNLQKLIAKLKLAFPSVTIVDTQQEFDEALQDPNVKQFVKDGEVVYGFTTDGKIFLNPDKANSNTAIHEFSHIWMNFLRLNNPGLLQKGFDLLEGTSILKQKIKELGDTELAREEAMADLIASRGELLVEAGTKSKFKSWLNAVFNYVKSKFKAFETLSPEQFQKLTLNQFVDGSLASLLSGKEITTKEIKSLQVLFSKQNDIDYIVATARANNIQDDAIEVYLRNNGFSDADIIEAMTQMKPARDISVDDIYRQSQEALKRRYDANMFVRLYRFVNRTIADRQEGIKRLMKGIKNDAAKRAFNMLVDKAGATGFASYRFKRADRVIYGGLTSQSIESLNKIIYARRIIDINVNRRKEGKPPYVGINGYNEANAMADLNKIRERLGEETYDNLGRRAQRYFDEFSLNLKRLYESGRINEDTYLRFRDREYSPIKVIKYIIGDNANPNNADSQASTLGVSRKDIQALSDKNENDIIMDSRWLLMMNIHTVEARAFENNMLVAWAEAIDNATQEEKNAISKYIKENPIVKTTKDGRPVQKYELGDFTRTSGKSELVGFTPITYFVDGQQRVMVVDTMYANQILDIKNVEFNNKMRKVGRFTGVGILRYMATVGNPLFILGNVPVDIANATFLTNVYSWFKPLALAQAVSGFSMKFIRGIYDDIRSLTSKNYENPEYREYVEHGGAIDFLSQDGIVGIKSALSTSALKSVITKPFLAIGATMSYLGTKSEFAMRLAVYSKQKKNLIAKYKKDNNGQEPKGQALDDIMWDAAREARELVDFSQGGSTIKAIDPVMPYLNAATQGVRKSVKFAKENPKDFAISMSQVALATGYFAYHSLGMALAVIPGEDEEEKLRKLKDALDSVPQHTKSMYHIHFTGKMDKDGNLQYVKIKKLPVVSILTTIIEQYAYKALFETHGGNYEADINLMWETVKKSMPIWPTELAGKNPGVAAYIALSYNIDTFTGKEIFKQPRDKKIKEQYQGKYDNKVEEFYKVIAPAFGASPKKVKVAIEKIITSPSTNPMVHVAYAAMNGIFGKDQTFYEDLKACGEMIIESAGNKLVKYTDPDILNFVREDRMKAMETEIESKIWSKEQEVYNKIDKVYDSGKELTTGELIDIVKNNFDEADHEKYAKKYYTYIQNRNTNKGMLDIIYERVPESQAYKLYMEFGPKISEDEMKYLNEVMELSGQNLSKKAYAIYLQKYGK